MKLMFLTIASAAAALALSSCGTSGKGGGNPQAMTGPFDSRGNYVEEWADNPSKWRKGGGSSTIRERKLDDLPEIAKVEQPPQDSVPIVVASASRPVPAISQTVIASKPQLPETNPEVVVATRPLRQVVKTPPVRVSSQTKSRSQSVVKASTSRKAQSKVAVSKTKAKTQSKPTGRVKEKVKAKVKTTPKSKVKTPQKPSQYVVKKGDSLSVIARKTGTSTAALKKKNGISGSTIRPGQKLVVPKN
jgi:LysM repeat protein